MSSIFKKIRKRNGTNALIKNSLITQLSNNIKEIQLELKDVKNGILCGNDATNSLCIILEAILLHGLKDTLIKKAKNALSDKIDQPPDISFWPLLLVFSHRDVIDNILSLQQITTDIGYCRAWVRLALNESLLSSYFDIMRKDIDSLSPYYKNHAFMRDFDVLEIAQKYIEGFESSVTFNLPYNSSLLNAWNHQTLLAAGIWAPPMKSHPISSAVDVVNTLPEESIQIPINTFQNMGLNDNFIPSPSTSLSHILSMNEQDALDIILSKSIEQENSHAVIDKSNEDLLNIDDESEGNTSEVTESEPRERLSSLGNSLLGKSAWSEGLEQKSSHTSDAEEIRPCTSRQNSASNKSNYDISSYNALLESYSVHATKLVSTPDLKSVWDNFYQQLSPSSTNPEELDSTTPELAGFEVVPNSLSTIFSLPELQMLVEQLCQLAQENGLDMQNYTCKSCSNALGIHISKDQVCAFSGDYYCESCMSTELFVIPAKIVYNWDFHRYHVSHTAARFLKEFLHHPLIDLKILNPYIYTVVEEMSQLQTLRIQLNFLRAYLFTCREPVIEELQKKLWPRDYLYEHVHLYSINDLMKIPGGYLKQEISQVTHFGKAHVIDCWLCSQKGYICEVCNDSKVLYPFNMEATFRCNACNAVYHSKCLSSSENCLKCARKRKREDIPLMDAVRSE